MKPIPRRVVVTPRPVPVHRPVPVVRVTIQRHVQVRVTQRVQVRRIR